MALFSRRTLQRILNENAKFLNSEQSVAHIKRLNEATDLSTEWEIVMLNAFSKLGNVIHEPTNLGNRQIDLCFCASENNGYSFVADITTVSDDGLDKNNPQHLFTQELNRILHKNNLNGDHFSYRIDGEKNKNFYLKLKDYIDILNGSFIGFLNNEVLTDPCSSHTFTYKTNECSFSISYIPGQRYQTGSHVSYTAAYTIKNNPIYNALKGKSEQLKGITYNGPKGVILCDGSCSILKVSSHANGSYGYKDVIQRFLESSSTISFVITVIPIYQQRSNAYTKAELFLNPKKTYSNITIPDINKFLPIPISSTENARYRLLEDIKDYRRSSFYGRLIVDNGVKISARELLALLSKQITLDKFLVDQPNVFASNLQAGKLFKNIKIEKCPDSDDDLIVFEFAHDPAISPFIVPNSSKE